MRGLALRIVLARTTILNAIGGCALSSYENRSHEMIGYIKSLTDLFYIPINLTFIGIIVLSTNLLGHVFGPEMRPVLEVRVVAFTDLSQQFPESLVFPYVK